MQIHPGVPRVNDKLKRFHAFLHRNQRAHQLLNVLVVCAATTTTTTTHLKVQRLHRGSAPSRKAGSGPSSFGSAPRSWLSAQPLSRRTSDPFTSNTLRPSARSATSLLEQLQKQTLRALRKSKYFQNGLQIIFLDQRQGGSGAAEPAGWAGEMTWQGTGGGQQRCSGHRQDWVPHHY